ncbi:MAG: Ldh family oxidoreductase, partial [Bacteroidota bacterium]
YLPGIWLVHQALDVALERVRKHPVTTLTIRRSHHIACLACFLERATDQNLMILLYSSDPANRSVAPYGAIEGVYSPDPISVGIPTAAGPVLIDTSMSTTANGVVLQKHKNGERLPHPWLLGSNGQPTDDPNAFFESPPATMLPIGGLDNGYKGFALGLMVEAMTNALSGYGRSDEPSRWTSSVFLQLIDPAAFGGADAFSKETSYLAKAAKQAKTVAGQPPVRLPGERARRLRQQQLEQGLFLYPTILPTLEAPAKKYGVALPKAIEKNSG